MYKLNIKRLTVFAIALLAIAGFIISAGGGSEDHEKPETANQSAELRQEHKYNDFSELSRMRFATIRESVPELNEIECLEDDCTSVIYFYFNTLPEDLEFMMRGNAKTFASFKYERTGTGHVTIVATHNGKSVYQCNANRNDPPDCK